MEADGWSRREFLKGAGVVLGLPFFPSLFPGKAWADGVRPPTRLMFMSVPLGFVPKQNTWSPELNAGNEGWWPEGAGADFKLPPVHGDLQPYREHLSFLRGLSNARYRGNVHASEDAFLTCADTLADPSRMLANTVSCDQVAAGSEVMGDVRHPSLALGVSPGGTSRSGGLSWTRQGVAVSPLQSPAAVFDQLFGPDEISVEERRLRCEERQSVLDAMMAQVGDLNRRLNQADRQRMDEVLSAVRGVETEIQREQRWISVAKPTVALARPEPSIATTSSRHVQAMLALAHAAFLTDSTRVISYQWPPVFTEISNNAKHALNHATTPDKAQDHLKLDQACSRQLADFLKLMCDSQEHDGKPLIHHLAAAYGASVWGPTHGMRDLPMMLIGHAGGRLAQGAVRAYPDPTPLANLWLTMLEASGVEAKSFADSTGTLDGLI
jgi:hypothetical protein